MINSLVNNILFIHQNLLIFCFTYRLSTEKIESCFDLAALTLIEWNILRSIAQTRQGVKAKTFLHEKTLIFAITNL